jgi:hypothetical protein
MTVAQAITFRLELFESISILGISAPGLQKTFVLLPGMV